MKFPGLLALVDRWNRLPPCGGSGLKYYSDRHILNLSTSPSMRREWIEITNWRIMGAGDKRSPSMRREWIEIISHSVSPFSFLCLPPCGGSGLKFEHFHLICVPVVSPSMRREWIEIVV